ncbi:CHAP domain-containing protein [Enterococcus sp. BWT-B8]|uniref:CHAP domain-containing protein n=1 Tax=Enterococcus sp. BWT-B8 TaxID=2885157 RepID=UPI001E312748|nr:CHAP domain-containing protein [Enterococcus sp. BWT-B8]MCB5951251.1 CHAP domain-containing protein [Enterococcus sp. BWT-B8]
MAVEGAVLIAGNQWLKGQGVPVYSNGGNYGTYYQCVELPQQRLYPKMGWPRVFAAGNGGAQYIPEGSPGLIRYNPGSKYVPVPGDLVIENGTDWNQYGHVSVVDYTDTEKGIIYAVEQNASANGRITYSYNGSNYVGLSASRSVKCILHAPDNGFKNPTTAVTDGLNSISISKGRIRLEGWHIDSRLKAGLKSYVFIMNADTKAEIARYQITRTARPDVGKLFPNIPESGKSGFDITVAIPEGARGKRIYVLSRYITADDKTVISDKNYTNNVVSIPGNQTEGRNSITVKNENVRLEGWHVDTKVTDGLKSYIFIMNADTGKEISRNVITRTSRPDVANVFPAIASAEKSGFDITIPIPAGAKGKRISVLSRYITADDKTVISDFYYSKNVVAIP